MINLSLPLSDGAVAVLRVGQPMNEQTWNHMMEILEVIKPGLVR